MRAINGSDVYPRMAFKEAPSLSVTSFLPRRDRTQGPARPPLCKHIASALPEEEDRRPGVGGTRSGVMGSLLAFTDEVMSLPVHLSQGGTGLNQMLWLWFCLEAQHMAT